MTLERKLLENIKMFIRSANLVFNTKDYTSATILYFKALFSILDFLILKDIGKTPKDHEERFRILEENYQSLYKILDETFPIYRDSYKTSISLDRCKKVKDYVEILVKKYNIG